jgi:LacI family transcriptional regulator
VSIHHRITIREIARMCGVSTQTVSRVINGRPDVSPETRKAVEAAIAATGFQPSAVARSLVHRRSQTLGVVLAGLRYFGVAQTLNGITEEAQASDFGLLLKEVDTDEQVDIVPIIDFLIGQRVEGIIFALPQIGTNIATVRSQLPTTSPPIVFLKSEPSPSFSTISIDNMGGARNATAHLLALGRRRIGHLAGPPYWVEADERSAGWRATLDEAGIEPGPVIQGNWSSASASAAVDRLLELEPKLDGLFVANDQMALGFLHAAHEKGIAVPSDVAIIGFDGLDEGAYFTPSLTTVIQPLRELGELAVREVIAMARDEAGAAIVRNLTLATQLVVRESAPAAATATGSMPQRDRSAVETVETR